VARWPDDPDSLVARSKWTRGVLSLGRTLISAAQQRQADVLLLTTPAASNRLPQPGDVRDRIQFLPHGLDTEFFSPESGWDSDENLRADQLRPSILFFANVSPRKGIWTLVDAFPDVVRSVPNVVLRIAGDGGILPDVKRRVAALDCAGQVEFLGRQERSQAPRLYRNASIYCLPSYGEPYATTVLEAMSCAKPIIVTDAGGLSHMVHDRGGKKVPVGDAASLAIALRDLLLNPSLRRSMGRYNRRLAETTMTWAAVTERLEEIYRVTIEKNRSPRHKHNPHNENPPASRAPQVRVQEGMSLSSVAGPKELT
jgi:glycosyltransferase involved in cell wall biosynthesis